MPSVKTKVLGKEQEWALWHITETEQELSFAAMETCPEDIIHEQKRLECDKPGDAGAGTDQLGDDQVGPCPAEQDALVAIEIGQDSRHHHLGEQAQAARAQRARRLENGCIEFARGVGDDQHLLKEGADDDDGDLRSVVDAQHRHRQRAEGRRRQVAEEFDEGLVESPQRGISAADDAQRHA